MTKREEMIVPACLEKQLWMRAALVFAALGLILTVSKFVPVPGISVADVMETCRDNNTGYIGRFPGMYFCPGPMLPHKELLASPLLGSSAVLAFVAIWLRRRLTND